MNIAVEGSHSLYCIDGGRTTKITNGKGNAHYHTPPDLLAASEAYRRGDVPLMPGIFQGDQVIHFEPLIDGGFERVSSPAADITPDPSTIQADRHTNLDHIAALDAMPGAADKRAKIEAVISERVAEFRAVQAEAITP